MSNIVARENIFIGPASQLARSPTKGQITPLELRLIAQLMGIKELPFTDNIHESYKTIEFISGFQIPIPVIATKPVLADDSIYANQIPIILKTTCKKAKKKIRKK